MKKNIILVIVAVLIIGGVWVIVSYNNMMRQGDRLVGPPRTPDATYFIEGKPVTFVGGLSDTGMVNRQITKYFGDEARGDLNGDGKADIASLLTQENGGSGTFFYLVVALATDKGYQGTNAIFLGDRIAPQSTEINNSIVTVNYADRNPGEPFTTQPSVGVSRHFKIVDNKLVEIK